MRFQGVPRGPLKLANPLSCKDILSRAVPGRRIFSAAIVAFIIYTMTLGKIREIAVLKLIGTRNRTIAGMILQQALGLGLIGFFVGKISATLWAPVFPKYVLLETGDAVRGLTAAMIVCALASTLAIRAALRVDPATAIG